MPIQKFKYNPFSKNKGDDSATKKIGVDRKKARPRPSKKSFAEITKITFKKHEKTFEKLAK